MRKSKKQKEQDLMKLHMLVMKKLGEAMMSVEESKQWKKVKADFDSLWSCNDEDQQEKNFFEWCSMYDDTKHLKQK